MSQSQVQAVLFGLALGDALGYPTEFMDINTIYRIYAPKGIQDPPNPAIFTDDTQMTIALTEGLLDAGLNAPIDVQMTAIAERFYTWSVSPENNRAPGNTCMASVGRYSKSRDWRTSGDPNSKGCGAAMRVALIGYLYQHDADRLRIVAENSALITHGHEAGVAAAVAGAYLVKLALDGVPVEEYMRRTIAFCGDMSDELMDAFTRVSHVLPNGSERHALDHIGEGWVGEEAVALALYCVLRYPGNYVQAVRRGANSNGDSDSIACIAGSIMGARLGLESIPADWRTRCEARDYLIDLSQRVAAARAAMLSSE